MTPRQNQRGISLRQRVLMLLLIVAPNVAWGQGITRATLPPAAQEALNKGIIAATVPDYLMAISFFEEARKIAPQAPVIYLNLGLAESRIPGRELRAIAWFGAYLAAYPHAPNAAAVKEQIAALEVRNRSNVSRLIKAVQDTTSQILGNDIWSGRGNKLERLIWVAVLQAQGGDITAALKMADLIQDGPYRRSAQSAIAVVQAKSGDIAGAKKTFFEAQKTADRDRDAGDKSYAYSQIAEDQIETGDIAGAQKTLASAIKNADLVIDTSRSAVVRSQLAQAQAKSGDIIGAQKTAELIQESDWKRYAQEAIAKAQAKAGIANARNTTRQLTSDVQALQLQPVITVSDWLKKLDDNNKSSDCPLNTEPFLDLAGYLKYLPPSNDPLLVSNRLYATAKIIVGAQNVIIGMLNQQAK